MGQIIDMREWRREREPRHLQVGRLERATERVDAATSGMRRRRAPAWLVDGVRRTRALLDEGHVAAAADLTEALAGRLERRGVG